MPSSPTTTIHGKINGQTARLITLSNKNNMQVQISELGADLISVLFPDDLGNRTELTLGHDSFQHWLSNEFYLGATCGRYGNRIAHGKFSLDHQEYTLATNNEPSGIPCHLHGGPDGLHTKIWHAELLTEKSRQGARLTLVSPDREEGYPGNLTITITYWLNDHNELHWNAQATTDKPTPVNIINHTYWNLSGNHQAEITDHQLQVHADYFLPTNAGMIPTGQIESVSNTPMDFTTPKLIGQDIAVNFQPLVLAGGYDHCMVLRDHHDQNTTPHTAAILHHPTTGRTLEILTNQPGLQLYTGNFLSGHFPRRTGLCLETENFPDAPNHPNFPTTILHPGETYRHDLIMKFT